MQTISGPLISRSIKGKVIHRQYADNLNETGWQLPAGFSICAKALYNAM
jgi:hypothetical protein